MYDEDVFDEEYNDDDVSTKYILSTLANSRESLKKVVSVCMSVEN